MPDDAARVLVLRLALSAYSTSASNQVIAEIGADRGRLMSVALELTGLLEEAIGEHDHGGAIASIENRLAAELDARSPVMRPLG